jgi:hypothetical protein
MTGRKYLGVMLIEADIIDWENDRDPPPFQCPYCEDISFQTLPGLKRHFRKRHDAKED